MYYLDINVFEIIHRSDTAKIMPKNLENEGNSGEARHRCGYRVVPPIWSSG